MRKLATWLAIAGMALNALWPLLANAGPAEFSAPVCSMVGTKLAPGVAGGLPAHPSPGKPGAPHCPFCPGVGDQSPALAACRGLAVVAPTASAQAIAVELFRPVSFLYLAAHPRGPPSPLI
jgi:hypothetical protein